MTPNVVVRSSTAPRAGIPYLVLALLGGALLEGLGWVPWALVAVVGVLLVLTAAQRTSMPFAFAVATVFLLVGYTVMVRLYPSVPLPLDVKNRIVLLSVGFCVLFVLWRQRMPIRLPRRETMVTAGLALLPVLLPGAALFGVIDLSGGVRASWAMHNDAIWNTVTARFIWADGGLNPAHHPNASPLTAALLAAAMAAGRSGVEPVGLLSHDVTRGAELWLVMTVISGVLAGLIALRSLRGVRNRYQAVAVAFASLIPLTWFVAGNAFQFGFYNGTVALLLLLSAWLAWLEVRASPLLATATLALATVALLATWAPLAAVTASLTGVAILSGLRTWWRMRSGWQLVQGGASVLAIPLYGLAVTVPDLKREGAALGADGGIFAISPTDLIVTAGVATGFFTLAAIALHRKHELVGAITVIGGGVTGLGYLLLQRAGHGNLWGYYPAKMAWLVMILLVVITAISIFSWLVLVSARTWSSLGIAGVAALVTLALMVQVPPNSATIAPALSIASPRGLSQPDDVTRLLFSLSNPAEKNLVIRYNKNSGHDLFVNGWLLQLQALSGEDPIRAYSYVLDGSDLGRVCAAVELWGGDVIVHTKSSSLNTELAGACENPRLKVVVHDG